MLISTLTKMDKDDSVLLYSHSGQTKDMIRIARLAKEYNAKAIIFIGNPSSKLKAYSDARLLIESQEFLFNLKTLSSRILFWRSMIFFTWWLCINIKRLIRNHFYKFENLYRILENRKDDSNLPLLFLVVGSMVSVVFLRDIMTSLEGLSSFIGLALYVLLPPFYNLFSKSLGSIFWMTWKRWVFWIITSFKKVLPLL